MAYIESHEELSRHWKVGRCASQLHIKFPTMLGHLHMIWHWALAFAKDGDLTRFTALEIAAAAQWDDDPDIFLGALTTGGWIDDDGETRTLHDWHMYGGKLVERRDRNAERMREARGASRVPKDENPQRQGAGDQAAERAQHDNRETDARALHVFGTCNARAKLDKHSTDKISKEQPAREATRDDEARLLVVAELRSFGVHSGVAAALVAHHTEDEIRRQLGWMAYRAANDPPAMLVTAIHERWTEPLEVAAERESDAAALAKRETERAKYAERERFREERAALRAAEDARIEALDVLVRNELEVRARAAVEKTIAGRRTLAKDPNGRTAALLVRAEMLRELRPMAERGPPQQAVPA